jgi:RNA polymerase sigma-70 factor, ECF subfamily
MNERELDTSAADELLPRVAAGDRDAFAALFDRYRRDVFRFALHMTASRALADDVTQEAFLAAMRTASRYQSGRSSERAWLLGIARNQVRRRLDRERVMVAFVPDDAPGAMASPEDHGDPLRGLVDGERVAAVRRAVASLPIHYREAVVLCDLEEQSYLEAAAALGCAVGTVRSRLSRARALLAAKLVAVEEAGRAAEPGARRNDEEAGARVKPARCTT